MAEPGSLAGAIARIEATSQTAPEHQITQWLFAFDPAGIATFRSLALLASHPAAAARAREEISTHTSANRQYLPFLRATVLESIRLWPTSPLILRESSAVTTWQNGTVPPNTTFVIFTPFFHRDDERLPYADRFAPDLWMDGQTAQSSPLIPFSEGPAICPGRYLVLLLSTAMLSALLHYSDVQLNTRGRLSSGDRLPGTLNHFRLRFELAG